MSKFKLSVLALASLILCPSAASADSSTSCGYNRYTKVYSCSTVTLQPPPPPKPPTAAQVAAYDAEDQKWESFCKPQRYYDDEGITRLRYAEKGCESGRSE